MIPPFTGAGVLLPGIHEADDWAEDVTRFGGTPRRDELLRKLRRGLDNLRDAGRPWVLLDGSFVTEKLEPNDVDGCWEDAPEVDPMRLDPCFLLHAPAMDRLIQQGQYGTDFFPTGVVEAVSGKPFSEFFQSDRQRRPRGIVRLDLTADRSAVGSPEARDDPE